MPLDIPGVGREDLAQLFAALDFKVGAEIGTEYGLYAETLCKANPELELHCIDSYLAYKGYREHKSQVKLDGIYRQAQQRLAPYNVKFHRLLSSAAYTDFRDGSLDFVYIDGNHSLLHVIEDLCYWVPKVRAGGIVSGHDFIRRDHTSYQMHVVQALHAYTQAYNIEEWFVLGTKAVVDDEVRDKPRSWMWVKE
jgi:predicted O-methyltransferase YrrM